MEEENEEEGSPDPDVVVDPNLEGEGEPDSAENVEEEDKAGRFKVHCFARLHHYHYLKAW